KRRLRFALIGFASLALGLLFLAGFAWRDLDPVRARVVSARDMVRAVADDTNALGSAPGRAKALEQLGSAKQKLDLARGEITSSTAMTVMRVVPGLRRQRAGMLDLIRDASTAVSAGQRLIGRA